MFFLTKKTHHMGDFHIDKTPQLGFYFIRKPHLTWTCSDKTHLFFIKVLHSKYCGWWWYSVCKYNYKIQISYTQIVYCVLDYSVLCKSSVIFWRFGHGTRKIKVVEVKTNMVITRNSKGLNGSTAVIWNQTGQ